jgi:hypothetical protein
MDHNKRHDGAGAVLPQVLDMFILHFPVERMNASVWPSGCLENTPEIKYLGATIRKRKFGNNVEGIILLEGFQASLAGPSDEGSMEVKRLGCLETVA